MGNNKDWDNIPYVAGDCIRDTDEWNDMIDYVRHSSCTDFTIYSTCPSTGQAFRFTQAGAVSKIYGGANTGDDCTWYANDVDTFPKVTLFGNSHIYYYTSATCKHMFLEGSSTFLALFEDGTDEVMEGQTINNDIYIKPNGTGVLKWGAETVNAGSDRGKLIKMKTEAGDTVYLKTYDLV